MGRKGSKLRGQRSQGTIWQRLRQVSDKEASGTETAQAAKRLEVDLIRAPKIHSWWVFMYRVVTDRQIA